MKKYVLSLVVFSAFGISLYSQTPMDMKKQEEYVAKNSFRKAQYVPVPLPAFETTRQSLPQPVFEEDPGYVEMYWKVWELAFKRFRQPVKGSPFVSNYIDEAFNEALFLWDTAFMTLFCNYGWKYVPGIQSLDNFYFSQMDDGEIVREIAEETGEPRYRYAKPGTPASLNHPILAWTELESFKISNDTARLRKVFYPLAAYYYSYNKIKDPHTMLYMGSWASMDNSPRVAEMSCGLDTSAEMVLFAQCMARIAEVIGLKEEQLAFDAEAKTTAALINKQMWNPKEGFYFDLNKKFQIHNVKTIAAYWTLLAGIADKDQAEALALKLQDTSEFKRVHRVPTVPASEPAFEPQGKYWRGGVWTPTNIMVVEGLKRYHYAELANEIALNHIERVYEIYKKTGTVWEFYQPDFVEVGFELRHATRPDFTGWTACVPIKLFIEDKIGLNINAPENKIVWNLNSDRQAGIRRLTFGNNTADLIAEAVEKGKQRIVRISSEKPFTLVINSGEKTKTCQISSGTTDIKV